MQRSSAFYPEPWVSSASFVKPRICWDGLSCGLRNRLKDSQAEIKILASSCVQQVSRILTLNEQLASLQSVRKVNTFGEQLTEDEANLIATRIALQQQQAEEFENRQRERLVNCITSAFPLLTAEEVDHVLTEWDEIVEEKMEMLGRPEILHRLRKEIALKSLGKASAGQPPTKRRAAFSGCYRKPKTYRLVGRLRLDEALAKLQSTPNDLAVAMAGWSSARIRAFKAIEENPNAYYYRFNAPGEAQRNGPWCPDERRAFLQRLQQVGADGNWGIFSQAIPGRVGYQCSNFYRKLLGEGVVCDPNYFQDSRGKWHFRFNSGGILRKCARRPTRPASNDDEETEQEEPLKKSMPVAEFVRDSLLSSGGEEAVADNPLPTFIDPVTLEVVRKPAISPYGHVMGYDSWLRCILHSEPKNICPLTKKPLKKRDLIILTFENIEKYRSKVIN